VLLFTVYLCRTPSQTSETLCIFVFRANNTLLLYYIILILLQSFCRNKTDFALWFRSWSNCSSHDTEYKNDDAAKIEQRNSIICQMWWRNQISLLSQQFVNKCIEIQKYTHIKLGIFHYRRQVSYYTAIPSQLRGLRSWKHCSRQFQGPMGNWGKGNRGSC
jgi:hypothetical protein